MVSINFLTNLFQDQKSILCFFGGVQTSFLTFINFSFTLQCVYSDTMRSTTHKDIHVLPSALGSQFSLQSRSYFLAILSQSWPLMFFDLLCLRVDKRPSCQKKFCLYTRRRTPAERSQKGSGKVMYGPSLLSSTLKSYPFV